MMAHWLAWLDERTGIARVRRALRHEEIPSNRNSWLAVGGVLSFALLLQLVTGWLLLLHFVPDASQAFDSVEKIMREVPFGWLVRLVHVHGASLLIALLVFHLYRSAFRGAFKSPRELVWMSGVVLFVLLLMTAVSGYILPWSQTAYWATTIITASARYVPWIGEGLVSAVRGGEFVGDDTYRRAFVAHASVLPLLILLMLAIHLRLIRRVGLSPPAVRGGRQASPTSPVTIFPHFALRYAISTVVFLLVLFIGIQVAPNIFFPAGSLLPADPFETPASIKPEWYMLWAYQLPQYIPEAMALTLQSLALFALLFLPFIDRSPHRHALDRPLATGLLLLSIVVLLSLTVLGHFA